MDFNEISYTDD